MTVERYHLGHIPDPPHKRTQPRSHELLGTVLTKSTATLEAHEATVFNQGGTESCGGHGTAQLLACLNVLPWVTSPDWIYKAARRKMREDSGKEDPLTDSGVYPSAITEALAIEGVIPYRGPTSDGRVSDVMPSTVNLESPLSDFEMAAVKIVTGGYRIDPTSPDFFTQIGLALAAGCSVGLGIIVDSNFQTWGRGWTPARGPLTSCKLDDPYLGGHWVACNAFDLSKDTGVFSGPNSWGGDWGAPPLLDLTCKNGGGHWRATGGFLRQAVSDALVFTRGTWV
jgi:hypothetical protein